MLQHPDPGGGGRLLPARLRATDEASQMQHFEHAHVHPHVCPRDSRTSAAAPAPSSQKMSHMHVHSSTMGHIVAQDIGKTTLVLPNERFHQRMLER